MQAKTFVFLDTIIKAIRSPSVGKEDNRNRLSEIVKLQTTSAYCIHDRRIVYHLNRYPQFSSTYNKISMSGRPTEARNR